MRTFRKKLFLQKIKEQLPSLAKIQPHVCKYKLYRYSEWLEFEYRNYYYVFYHSRCWNDSKITYRKCYFDAVQGVQHGPIIIGDLYSGALEAKAV